MPRQLPRFKEWLKNIFPQYVKSFASYYFSQQKFPDTILMISYEKLMRDNKTALSDIAQFMGISQEILDGPAFEAARLVTGKDSMRRLEFFLGRTLAGDQRLGPSKESHIRGGSVGKWKDSFTVRNYEYAVGELEKMQIPLNFFETE